MIKAIAVIIVMLAVNGFMVFAIVKASARLDDSLRRYFVTKVGSSEYSVIPMRNTNGTFVGGDEDSDYEVKAKKNNEAETEYFDAYGNVNKGGREERSPYSGYGGTAPSMSAGGAGTAQNDSVAPIQKKEREIAYPTRYPEFSMERTIREVNTGKGNQDGMNANGSFRIPTTDKTNLIPSADDSNAAHYKNSDLKDDYRVMKQLALLDKEHAVHVVKAAQSGEADLKGNAILGILQLLDYDTAFTLSGIDSALQLEALRETFDPLQNEILDQYVGRRRKRFNAIDFYGYIQGMADSADPEFYVFTGLNGSSEQYGPGVRTKFDPEIAEGIKVVYKDKLYDYSI